MSTERQQWFDNVNIYAQDNLISFYEDLYSPYADDMEIEDIGDSGVRLQACPMCGHFDCATAGEALNCFSAGCDWSGSHAGAWLAFATDAKGLTYKEAVDELARVTGLTYPGYSEQDAKDYREKHYREIIFKEAERFYHRQLMESDDSTYFFRGEQMTPKEYLIRVRGHSLKAVEDWKIGFVRNTREFHRHLTKIGFSYEEIESSKVWCPDGVFIYFYRDPITKQVTRFNTKNPFGMTWRSKDGGRGREIVGFSSGEKVPFCSPGFSYKKPFILVEGEDDAVAVYTKGQKNVMALGGQIKESLYREAFEKAEDTIYIMKDNDKPGADGVRAGDVYVEKINNANPDKDIRIIKYPENIGDPNDYFREMNALLPAELMRDAEVLKTDGYVFERNNKKWTIKNRHKTLTFEMDGKFSNGELTGVITLYGPEGNIVDKEVGKGLTKAKKDKAPFSFYLYDEMSKYFNIIEDKTVDELAEIYPYTSKKGAVIDKLAKEVKDREREDDFINDLKLKLRTPDGRDDVFDEVLKEVNNLQNQSVGINVSTIPTIKVSQYFNTRNNDAYMYFLFHTRDGDTLRRLPYLVRNDGEFIRLDILKRKDENCLLLIDNKYELPTEISEAIMDPEEVSLTQEMAEKYRDGKIDKKRLNPRRLADELREYFVKFYHTRDSFIYDILALYTMMTYYYELFDQMPYLFINGHKGTGKSVLGSALHLLCFNAKMATNITDAGLFRVTSLEGGTLILDEMENLTSRQAGADTVMGSVLKGGYKKRSHIYRSDKESDISVNKYDSYGPKIIINIFGLDDIIEDRCIPITTFRYKPTKGTRKEDPKAYLNELDTVRELTSRCCLSALENFQTVNDIYSGEFFESDNARLSEILTPMLVMARFVDMEEREAIRKKNPDLKDSEVKGHYEKAIEQYYQTTIRASKAATEGSTPEGIIKTIVPRIAEEVYGLIPEEDIEYANGEGHKYNAEIAYNKEEGWFELNTIHLKCFMEENMPGEKISTKVLTRWVKSCYELQAEDIRRAVTKIDNQDLIYEFNGNESPKVSTFKFYFKDFLEDQLAEKLFDDIDDDNDFSGGLLI